MILVSNYLGLCPIQVVDLKTTILGDFKGIDASSEHKLVKRQWSVKLSKTKQDIRPLAETNTQVPPLP